MFEDILDNVGMQIYSHLHPKDVFSLGSCSHRLRQDIVHVELSNICLRALPLQLGAGSNYLAEFRAGRSFSDKAELLKHVLDKTDAAHLVLVDARTATESRRKAREVLLRGDAAASTAKFQALRDETSQRGLARAPPVTVECYYQSDIEKRAAMNWAQYSLNRDACTRNGTDMETHRLIQEWLQCLFSRNDARTTFGMWRWSCKHRDLHGHGIAGVGVMIATAPPLRRAASGGANNNCATTMEIRLTRKY